jgi:hypothetical protein
MLRPDVRDAGRALLAQQRSLLTGRLQLPEYCGRVGAQHGDMLGHFNTQPLDFDGELLTPMGACSLHTQIQELLLPVFERCHPVLPLFIARKILTSPRSSLMATTTSVQEIDKLITELQTLRDVLHSEGARLQREIVEYSTLTTAALHSTKIIAESLTQLKKVPDAPTLPELRDRSVAS